MKPKFTKKELAILRNPHGTVMTEELQPLFLRAQATGMRFELLNYDVGEWEFNNLGKIYRLAEFQTLPSTSTRQKEPACSNCAHAIGVRNDRSCSRVLRSIRKCNGLLEFLLFLNVPDGFRCKHHKAKE